MSSPNPNDLRRASPSEVVAALQSKTELTNEEFLAVLTNAFERIATIENAWDDLARAFRIFDEKSRSASPSSDGGVS